MGDRHGGRFARRGRALNPPRPQVDAHRGVGLRWREGERICAAQELAPRRKASRHGTKAKGFAHARRLSSAKASRHGARAKGFARAGTLSSAKASRHGARAKEFAPRRNALLDEGIPTRRTSERICPAQKHAPRRRPPDTAHVRKDLPPRRNTPLGESLPTRRTSERICAAQEHAPRRRLPDTAHERKDLPRAETLSSAKASRHGARAKEFVPRRNTPHGEGLPTRRTSERVCPAQKRSPRRRPPDTAHERKDLPRGSSPSPHVPTNGGPPSTDGQPEKHPFGGVAPERARPLPSSFTEKK